MACFLFFFLSSLFLQITASEGQIPLSPGHVARKSPLDEDFTSFAKQVLDEWKIPGLSIAVVDDEDVYSAGIGFATLPDKPATPDTVWYAGSTTKAFTAIILSHMIDSGNYSSLSSGWSTRISSIIRDDFVLEDEWVTNHLTLEDAVSHRTGMPRHDMSTFRQLDGRKSTPGDIVRNLRNLKLVTEPRITFLYCNLMFIALSHVIETLTGKWLGDVLKEHIWTPLGMTSTYFDLEEAKRTAESFATGYYWDRGDGKFKSAPDLDLTEISGAGSVFSSVNDYAKWLRCLLHEDAPFSKNTHDDVKIPRMMDGISSSKGLDLESYSLAWQRSIYRGQVIYRHSGGVHAFGSQAYWLPEYNFGVVAFANTAMSSNAAEDVLVYRLINDRLGIPEDKRHDPSKRWRKILDDATEILDGAIEKLYPDRPDPPLPSTLNTSQLVGTYHNPGYKTITLREAAHPDGGNRTILLAERPEMTWRYKMELHHITADHWIVYLKSIDIPGSVLNDYAAAEFRIGGNGKPEALKVSWINHDGSKTTLLGTSLFNKIN